MHPHDEQDEFFDEEPLGPSKTSIKREMHELQQLALDIATLPTAVRQGMKLPEALNREIDNYVKINSNRAKKRQAQYLGKVMRLLDEDQIEQVETAYQQISNAKKHVDAKFHECEHWRERLINDDERALTELINQYPSLEVQKLRQLIKKAQKEKAEQKNLGASKALFRLLREAIDN